MQTSSDFADPRSSGGAGTGPGGAVRLVPALLQALPAAGRADAGAGRAGQRRAASDGRRRDRAGRGAAALADRRPHHHVQPGPAAGVGGRHPRRDAVRQAGAAPGGAGGGQRRVSSPSRPSSGPARRARCKWAAACARGCCGPTGRPSPPPASCGTQCPALVSSLGNGGGPVPRPRGRGQRHAARRRQPSSGRPRATSFAQPRPGAAASRRGRGGGQRAERDRGRPHRQLSTCSGCTEPFAFPPG